MPKLAYPPHNGINIFSGINEPNQTQFWWNTADDILYFYNDTESEWWSVAEYSVGVSFGNTSTYTGAQNINWSGARPTAAQRGIAVEGWDIKIDRFSAHSNQSISIPDNVGLQFYVNGSTSGSRHEWDGTDRNISFSGLSIAVSEGDTWNVRYEVGASPTHAGKVLAEVFYRRTHA